MSNIWEETVTTLIVEGDSEPEPGQKGRPVSKEEFIEIARKAWATWLQRKEDCEDEDVPSETMYQLLADQAQLFMSLGKRVKP